MNKNYQNLLKLEKKIMLSDDDDIQMKHLFKEKLKKVHLKICIPLMNEIDKTYIGTSLKKKYPLGNFVQFKSTIRYDYYLNEERENFYYRLRLHDYKNFYTGYFEFIKNLEEHFYYNLDLVKSQVTNLYYCMKCYNKLRLNTFDSLDKTLLEKKILYSIRFPFLTHSEYIEETSTDIILTLPLCLGGSLGELFNNLLQLPENVVQFFAAQLVLAIEYLHNVDIIHRDIRPDNIYMDHLGYIKLGNFSLCKFLCGEKLTKTICGEIEYQPPEMIKNLKYDKGVDMWQLGILIYHLILGETPFYDDDVDIMCINIVNNRYEIPQYLPYPLVQLLIKLLDPRTENRIGNSLQGINELKEHLWFSDISWLTLLQRKYKAPLEPIHCESKDNIYYNLFTDF